MRRSIAHAAAAVAASATLSVLGAGAAGVAGEVPLALPGAQLWVQRYNGPVTGYDSATAVAVSPNGGTVYVTGASYARTTTSSDYATVAYNAATGAGLWTARYNGPGNRNDRPASIVVSPDGRQVFVTGDSVGATSHYDYATIAYNAATGARLWVARYGRNADDGARSVAVSPDGRKVYVTGYSTGASSAYDYATIAYNAATGARLWVARYNNPLRNYNDEANAVAVSPDGRTVYVTGGSYGKASGYDYGTIAYNAVSGAQLWVARYHGPGNGRDYATAIGVSPDGGNVYVTGGSFGVSPAGNDYATVAYNAATGARLWVARYNSGSDVAIALAVSPAGTVFVTGSSWAESSSDDYATIAYSPAGAQLWLKRYNGPGNGEDIAFSIAAPGNGKVYISGRSLGKATDSDYATIAYSVFTGAQQWVARYNGPGNSWDSANAVAARAGRVFVTGLSMGTRSADYATIAYGG